MFRRRLVDLRLVDLLRIACATTETPAAAAGARSSRTSSHARARAGAEIHTESCGRAPELQRGNRDASPDFFGQQRFRAGKDRRQDGRIFSQGARLFQTFTRAV